MISSNDEPQTENQTYTYETVKTQIKEKVSNYDDEIVFDFIF
jgi:hypothetical protein